MVNISFIGKNTDKKGNVLTYTAFDSKGIRKKEFNTLREARSYLKAKYPQKKTFKVS